MPKSILSLLLVLAVSGCMKKSLEEQTKKSDGFIVGKTTTEVGKFDPNADNKVSDSKVKIDNPVTGGCRPMVPWSNRS